MQALKRQGMRMRRRWIVPLALLAVASPSAHAAFLTGNELMEKCKGTDIGEPAADIGRYNSCVAYLAAVYDTVRAFIPGSYFCLPGGTQLEQTRQVFLQYMAKHPEDWHFDAAGSAVLAFSRAWPCSD